MESILGRGYSINEESDLIEQYSPLSSTIDEDLEQDDDLFYAEENHADEQEESAPTASTATATLSSSSIDEISGIGLSKCRSRRPSPRRLRPPRCRRVQATDDQDDVGRGYTTTDASRSTPPARSDQQRHERFSNSDAQSELAVDAPAKCRCDQHQLVVGHAGRRSSNEQRHVPTRAGRRAERYDHSESTSAD